MPDDVQERALDFVRAADLPEMPDAFLSAEESARAATPPDYRKPELAVTVGSQISSFAASVDAAQREQIANAFLFAQQAADKQIAANPNATSTDWYATYTDVLSRIGWTIEDRTATVRAFRGSSASVHEAIIPIVTAALGSAAVATPLIVQVLEGLQDMDQDRPWITLFSRASQRAHANQFQIAHVDKDGAVPRIQLVAFELDAERSLTQVLFVKFSTDHAELLHFGSSLSVNEPIFAAVAPIIQERLEDRVARMVLEIEI